MQTLTHQLVPTWVLQFCFFLFFLMVFSMFCLFLFLTKSIKNLEKSKKTQKTKLQTLTHQLVPTWVLQFVCFVSFWFLNVFWFLTKTSRNDKKVNKNKIACVCVWSAAYVVSKRNRNMKTSFSGNKNVHKTLVIPI